MQPNDRTVRRLTALEQSSSTARVLNLVSAHRRVADVEAMKAAPFFQDRRLDHCLILKHRLRPHEYELFSSPRPTVTKVLIPIDPADLKVGARSLMIGQTDFERIVDEMLGGALKVGKPDRQVLDLISELPSLDPFLVKEHLGRSGFHPARGYFAISDADVLRMYEFVRGEVIALVTMSMQQGQTHGAQSHAYRLVEKLLSNHPDAGFEPLKETLKLSDREYMDGMFSWKGFLYYKWVLEDVRPGVADILHGIRNVQPRGPRDAEATAYLPGARRRLHDAVIETIDNVSRLLSVYDQAYAALTQDGQPMAFRDFLLAAPDMFMSLGEQLGAIQHVVSFWTYRFTDRRLSLIAPDELMDLFMDFEDSLAFTAKRAPLARVG